MKRNCFGKTMGKIRIDRDETVKDMAKNLGVNPSCLIRYERLGVSPSKDVITRACDYYNVSQTKRAQIMKQVTEKGPSSIRIDLKSFDNDTRKNIANICQKIVGLSSEDIARISRSVTRAAK